MPRELFTAPREETLVASPESATPKPELCDGTEGTIAAGQDGYNNFAIHRDETQPANAHRVHDGRAKPTEEDNLHPYVQTLSISNLEDCVALEKAVFPENERCSREKFIYRLTVCPELCLGLFTTVSSPPTVDATTTYESAHPADSAKPNLKSLLIAMIVATKVGSHAVTDESMDIPRNWRELQGSAVSNTDVRGHQEHGRTIALHSLGVLPSYRRRGLAKTIMKSYQQRMETSGIADRIALLAHDHLVKMYKDMGFEDRGKSEAKFGGGGWNDLIYEFAEHGPGS